MNKPSVEIGWIIKNPKRFTYEGYLFETAEEDENGYYVPDTDTHDPSGELLYIETHPFELDRVFVKLWDACHGLYLEGNVEPQGLGEIVRDYIKKLDQEAIVTFGIIETLR